MPEENTTAGKGRSLNWWLRLIFTTVILFALAIAAYIYLFIYGGWGMISSTLYPTPEADTSISINFPNLRGGIFLSAIIDSGEDGTRFVPMLVSPETHGYAYIPVDQLASGPVFALQHSLSADVSNIAFLGWPLTEEYGLETPAVYRAETGGQEATSYNEVIQNIQTSATLALEPDEEDYFRQGPVVSDSAEIIYSSLSEEGFDPEPAAYGSLAAEDWTIYRLDADNQRYNLTNGLAPKWIDDERFVFLKNDGIYLYTISTSEERLVWSLSLTPTLVNAFDVSDDGQLIAISNPEAELVTILESTGWEGDSPLAVMSEVSAKASGVTFSADNSYLAMFRLIASDEAGTEGFARLTYYSLEMREFNDRYVDLEDPRLQGLYMTDWK